LKTNTAAMKFRFAFLFLVLVAAAQAQIHTCMDMVGERHVASGSEGGVFDYNKQWSNGSRINVKFKNGGSAYVRNKIKTYAQEWEKYANIDFVFIESGTPDILISVNSSGSSWSYVGTDSRIYAQRGETSMNFGWFDDNTSEENFKRTTMHEFGHAIGLLHEHKNPLSKIKWNLPVVYNHYQAMGWSINEINDQVISRYSVDLSNQKYDPKSIMHYPIDPKLTLDGYSVGWNTNISAGDIKLVGEMYPRDNSVVVINTNTNTNTSTPAVKPVVCTGMTIKVAHNVTSGGVKGMTVKGSFNIQNAKGRKCKIGSFFMLQDGTPLKDQNGLYKSSNGEVASYTDFTPLYESTNFTDLEVFIPYDELHLGNGKTKLKFIACVWDDKLKNVYKSGAYFFEFTKGAICDEVELLHSFDNTNNRMVVMPRFTIENAQLMNCKACVYFYFQDGTPLYKADGTNKMAYCEAFKPAYNSTIYNSGYYSDLYINIPYDDFYLESGTHDLKFFVAIFDSNNRQIASSGWENMTMTVD
jgi:hypothetical protein